MEDKLFELMTKMYSDINSKMDAMDKKLEVMDEKLLVMDKKLDNKADKQDIVHIENKLDSDSKALYDGYKQTYEKLTAVEKKVNDIAVEVEKQDVEITVIKGGKKTKAK